MRSSGRLQNKCGPENIFESDRPLPDAPAEPGPRLDEKLEIWKTGVMKTTLDLPAELVREMKLRAAQQGRKLRDVATEVFRCGLSQSASQKGIAQHRVRLPLIECGSPRTARKELTPYDVAAVLLRQEAEWSHEAAGR